MLNKPVLHPCQSTQLSFIHRNCHLGIFCFRRLKPQHQTTADAKLLWQQLQHPMNQKYFSINIHCILWMWVFFFLVLSSNIFAHTRALTAESIFPILKQITEILETRSKSIRQSLGVYEIWSHFSFPTNIVLAPWSNAKLNFQQKHPLVLDLLKHSNTQRSSACSVTATEHSYI